MAPLIVTRNNVRVLGNTFAERTLLFGHGFGTNQESYAEVIKAFEDDYRIVLYDNAGDGETDIHTFNPARYSTLNGYVSDLLDICKTLNLRDVTCLGHSVSGMVSLLASIKAPQYFSKLILLGASPRYLNDPAENYFGGFEQADLDELFDAMRNNYYAWASGFSVEAMNNQDRPQLAEQFANTLKAVRPDIALAVVKMIFQSDHRADLPKCTVPTTLIMQTAYDIAVPEQVGAYMNKHIPNSQLVKLDTKGHFPQMSAPYEVVNAIKSFI